MKRMTATRFLTMFAPLLLAFAFAQAFAPLPAFAEEQSFDLGVAVNAGTDTGYSESNAIEEDDPQFGWSLGQFSISGFTSVKRDDGTYTFLKTSGDTVSLNFRLNQDIERLNDNEALSIADDTNGYDEAFGVAKSDPGFGRGTLIIRQTNYQNSQSDPQVYNDYLSAVAVGADTQVQVFEEGDYEVALDYEIRNDPRKLPVVGWSVLPTYSDYAIRFNFSVRNGNTMVFLFDTATGSELTNSSTTENGFTIDLARSRYLDINVKREVLASDGEDLVEDTRYNGPAKDGEQYTEPGVYTITATNPSTGQSTEKKIYVGSDPVLVTYVNTGYSIDEIRDLIDQGAQISPDGTITWPASAAAEEAAGNAASADGSAAEGGDATRGSDGGGSTSAVAPVVFGMAAAVVVATVAILARRRKGRRAGQGVQPAGQAMQKTNREIQQPPEDDEADIEWLDDENGAQR